MSTRTPEDRIYLEVRGRQAYGARLLGTHPRSNFEREWCHRRQSLRGIRGLWVEIGPEPGWYETSTLAAAGYKLIRSYWAYDGNALEPISAEWCRVAVTGPAPGQPGAFYGTRCACGDPVDRYTDQGWPICTETAHSHKTGPKATGSRKSRQVVAA